MFAEVRHVKQEYSIQFFSKFIISDGKTSLTQEQIRSDMLVKLIAYLVFHSGRACTIQELSDALWPEDSSTNPAGALKNLAYRLRTLLKKIWPDTEFVITGKGCYSWNPDLMVNVDAAQMAADLKQLKSVTEPEEKIRISMHAFELYKGKLLSDYSSEHWIMPRTAYYESQYLELAKSLAELLEAQGEGGQMERVCLRALTIEPLDEKLHELLIRAQMLEGKIDDAEQHYHATEKLLYDSLGVGPSESMRMLHTDLMKQHHEQELDLETIQKELNEADASSGAFFCEYGVYKKFYELEARRAARMGMTIYIGLLTMVPIKKEEKDSAPYLKTLEEAMEQMREVVRTSLRSGDVFTRYSVNQYLIMLPSCPYENAKMVMERILKNFDKVKRHAKVRLQYSLKEMEWHDANPGSPVLTFRQPTSLHLCVDAVDSETGDFSGTISGVGLADNYTFHNASDFMVVVEKTLNIIGKPQSSRMTRTFDGGNKPQVPYTVKPPTMRSGEEIGEMRGKLATYDMEFRTRYYSTWQGVLYDGEGKKIGPFVSALELIGMICHK